MRGAVVVAIAILGIGAAGCGSTRQAVKQPPSGLVARAAPVPAGVGSRFNEELSQVQCPAAGNCVVSGYGYTLGRPPSAPQTLVLDLANGKWSVFTVPLPPNLPTTAKKSVIEIASLACPAAHHCVGVGAAHADTSLDILILTQHGQRWRVSVLKPPFGATYGGLTGISCAAVGECSAIGWFQKGHGRQRLAFLDERGGRWGRRWREKPLPPNASPNVSVDVRSLVCTGPGDCTAIGSYQAKNYDTVAMLITERNGSWGRISEPAPPSNVGSRGLIELAALSCPSTGNCTVLGNYFDTRQSQQGFFLTERRGRWSRAVEAPVPPDAVPNIQHGDNPESPLTSLSCPSVGNCSADGWYRYKADAERLLLLNEKAGKWTAEKAPLPSDAAGGGPNPGGLGQVACVSAGNCVAVGGYVTGTRPDGIPVARDLLLVERHGVWTPGVPSVTGVDMHGAVTASLSLVSCPPTVGDCLAVGSYANAENVDHGELLTVTRP